jgi:hypothetical protein
MIVQKLDLLTVAQKGLVDGQRSIATDNTAGLKVIGEANESIEQKLETMKGLESLIVAGQEDSSTAQTIFARALEKLESNQDAIAARQEAIIRRNEESRVAMVELKSSLVEIYSAVERNHVKIKAGHAQVAALLNDAKVPWLFMVVPCHKTNKKWFKHPRKWMKSQHRVHLLCNGNKQRNTPSHFTFDTAAELKTKKGYKLLQPTEQLKKWGPVLKFTMGALSMAAKGAANFFAPGLSNMFPQLELLFENDDFTTWTNEAMQDAIGSIADGIVDSVSGAGVVDFTVPSASEYKACQTEFADWIKGQDEHARSKHGGDTFFGLEYYPNTEAGVGEGDGTPLWLCKGCHPGRQ